ncbi:MAG TPA: glycosyltransferase family 4 protein [Nitrolancea sp.]|nr:glycosyltransferase family 4 protein [Nitrolancea sp.]
MHLVHVIQRYYPFLGGSERYFQAFCERFVADGHVVEVVTTDAWDLEYFWDPRRRRVEDAPSEHNDVQIHRVPVHHLPVPSLTHRAIRRLMAESARWDFPAQMPLLRVAGRYGPWVPELGATLRQGVSRPDLIHSANIAFESMVAEAARQARSLDVPHVITPFVHLGEGEGSRVRRYYTMPHQLRLLRDADAVMVLTGIEADYLIGQGVDPARLHVVGAGLNVEAVIGGDGSRIRDRLGIAGPFVLSLGAAAFDKGTIHLVQAVTRLNRSGHEVALVVAGPVLSEFQRFLETLDSRDRRWVHPLGFVSEEEKRDLLAAADLLALPSRTESYGLVFLEAWANGKPVIGARAGAVPAVIEDGADGLLVPFGHVAALAEAIRILITDRDLAARFAAWGRAKVIDEATWSQRVRSVYGSVLGSTAEGMRQEEGVGNYAAV